MSSDDEIFEPREDSHAKERIQDLKKELEYLKRENQMTVWDGVKQFFGGVKELLAGKIKMVPELNYPGLGSLQRSYNLKFMDPPDLDAIPPEDRVKVIQAYGAIRAAESSMTDVLKTIVGLHYRTGSGWLAGRIFKSIIGMYIMLRIVETLSPIWN